jgi:threonine dehydratase
MQYHGFVLPGLPEIEAAADIVRRAVPPTPQFCWPLLCERLGMETWVKHENHTPIGAFKIRGGLVYFEHLSRSKPVPRGVISATRGNHGQSVACAARRYGIPATIVVPRGNSREKNAAMRAQGAMLIEHGDDFQSAREHAETMAREQELHMVPAFHPLLVLGVATGSLELLRAVKGLDTVYVPIGMGSGICAMIACRDGLHLKTAIVGVVSAQAPAYARSFAAGVPVEHPVTTKLADGLAVRTPDAAALQIIREGADRIVEVSDAEVGAAMRLIFECTHNVAEGAGAAAVAAAMRERDRNNGRRVAVVLSGGNVDREVFSAVLA